MAQATQAATAYTDTMPSFGKTLGALVGLSTGQVNSSILSGKVVTAAVSSA